MRKTSADNPQTVEIHIGRKRRSDAAVGRLTDAAVKKTPAGTARKEIADSTPGLYLVVQPSGKKSWAFRFRSPTDAPGGQRRSKKLTLGPLAQISSANPKIGHPLTVTQARMLATKAAEDVLRGIDPTAVRREQKIEAKRKAAKDDTIDAAMIEFLQRYRGRKRQGLRDSTRLLTAHYFGLKPDPENPGQWRKSGNGVLKHWSGRKLGSIAKRDAIVLLDSLVDAKHGVTANRTLTVLKTFFNFCVKRDMREASPVAALDAVAEETGRENVLTDSELVALWIVADQECYPFGRLVQLLILTGARRDELREATWAEFDLEGRIWTLPANRAKNGRAHIVPLSPTVVDILKTLPRIGRSKFLFTTTGDTPVSGLSKVKDRLSTAMLTELRKIDSMAALGKWTIHDLRRTFATGLQKLAVPVEVIEECLNHKSGTRSGVAGVYARHRYLTEKRKAFEAWARHINALVNNQSTSNVVPLHGAAQ